MSRKLEVYKVESGKPTVTAVTFNSGVTGGGA